MGERLEDGRSYWTISHWILADASTFSIELCWLFCLAQKAKTNVLLRVQRSLYSVEMGGCRNAFLLSSRSALVPLFARHICLYLLPGVRKTMPERLWWKLDSFSWKPQNVIFMFIEMQVKWARITHAVLLVPYGWGGAQTSPSGLEVVDGGLMQTW